MRIPLKIIHNAICMSILGASLAFQVWAAPPLSEETFAPFYPVGGSAEPAYETAVATLPGLGLLSDFPAGKMERCSTNGEAELFLVIATFETVAAGEFACEADPEPISKAICFGVIQAAELVAHSANIANGQCAFQDALIDAAEIQAGFENTELIHSDLGLHDDRLVTHDQEVQAKLDLILARQLEVVRLIHTPNGKRSTTVPACNGGPCSWNPK